MRLIPGNRNFKLYLWSLVQSYTPPSIHSKQFLHCSLHFSMSNSLEIPRNCFLITSLYEYSFLEARASGIRNFIHWFAIIKLLYFVIFNVVQFRCSRLIIHYLVQQIAQSTVYTNLSLTFLLHVSTSTRP